MLRFHRSAARLLRSSTLVAALPLTLSACFLAGHPASNPGAAGFSALEAEVTNHPGDVNAALRLAAAYRSANRLNDARVLLERTAANAPRNDAVALLLGLTYEDLGRLADARALYRRYGEANRSSALHRQIEGRLAVVERLGLQQAAKQAVAREAELSASAPAPHTVAVFPFLFSGDDPQLQPLSRALAEMLSTDLAQTDRLSVLERARVQALIDEAALARSGLTEPSTAVRTGHLLGAANVVQGRIGGAGGEVRLEAQLVSVGAAGLPASITRQASARQVLDTEKALALAIYDQLGVQLTPAERERVSRRPTQNLQALLAFGIALERQDAGDFAGAAEAFRRAAALDPGFAAARQGASSASVAASAASTPTAIAAAAVMQEAAAAPTLGSGIGIEDVANLPVSRDPASEGLGGEQVGRARTGIEIVVRRP
jgi:TolB-like protein